MELADKGTKAAVMNTLRSARKHKHVKRNGRCRKDPRGTSENEKQYLK